MTLPVTAMRSGTYAAVVPNDEDRFDVQRRSPFTPEGQIESAGRFARGLGAERLRRYIAVALIAWMIVAVVLVVLQF